MKPTCLRTGQRSALAPGTSGSRRDARRRPRNPWPPDLTFIRGERPQVFVNGQITADVTDATSREGTISLQCDGNGGSIEFQSIHIKELGPGG